MRPAERRLRAISARGALIGYQKGRCFYCYRPVGIAPGEADLADVDHVFPFTLRADGLVANVDQVWNLVLACPTCNRGPRGKFAAPPHETAVERLYQRNEYFIASNHPIKESLIHQTGPNELARWAFLQRVQDIARMLGPGWLPPEADDPTF